MSRSPQTTFITPGGRNSAQISASKVVVTGVVSEGFNAFRDETGAGTLLITHYTRILRYIAPDYVHVFFDGRIVESGGPELAAVLEAEGYERFVGAPAS